MNVNDLRKSILANAEKVHVAAFGADLYFLPVGVYQGIALQSRLKSLPEDGEGRVTNSRETFEVFVDVIRASVANDAGVRFLDNDEGRAFLLECSFEVLDQLTHHALKATGIHTEPDAEKNSLTPAVTSESPENSVSVGV